MTLVEIRDQVCFYLQQDHADFEVGTTDMVLLELNEARRALERRFDFRMFETTAEITLDSSGIDLLEQTTTDGYEIKSPLRAWLLGESGNRVPIDILTNDQLHNKHRRHLRRNRVGFRYLADNQMRSYFTNHDIYLIWAGSTLKWSSEPPSAVTLSLDVLRWSANWVAWSTQSDWWTNNASDYLKWTTILNLNQYSGAFVERQEGNPGQRAMADAAERAAQSLMQHDDYLSQSHITL